MIEESIKVYKNLVKARSEDCINYQKEIERLNNIIDELEKDIRNNMEDYEKLYEEQDEEEYIDKYFALKAELNKLKELKEGK